MISFIDWVLRVLECCCEHSLWAVMSILCERLCLQRFVLITSVKHHRQQCNDNSWIDNDNSNYSNFADDHFDDDVDIDMTMTASIETTLMMTTYLMTLMTRMLPTPTFMMIAKVITEQRVVKSAIKIVLPITAQQTDSTHTHTYTDR